MTATITSTVSGRHKTILIIVSHSRIHIHVQNDYQSYIISTVCNFQYVKIDISFYVADDVLPWPKDVQPAPTKPPIKSHQVTDPRGFGESMGIPTDALWVSSYCYIDMI